MSTVRHKLKDGTFQQEWFTSGQVTTDDDWSLAPSIVGYLGSGLTSTPGVDPRTLTAADPNPTVDVIANQTNPDDAALGALGGVAEFEPSAFAGNRTIALGASDTADAPYIVIYLDSTDRKQIDVSFIAYDIENSPTLDNATTPLVVQYRTSPTSDWTNVFYLPDATQGPDATRLGVDVRLPTDANNCPTLEVRIMTTNQAGNDEWIGIDDIRVESTNAIPPAGGEFRINDIGNVIEGDSGVTAIVFTITRFGGAQGAATVTYRLPDSQHAGAVSAADFDFTTPFNSTLSFADGEVSKDLIFYLRGDTTVEQDELFNVTLIGVTGNAVIGTDGDQTGSGIVINDDPKPILAVDDITITEGTGGTSTAVFTITRTGSGEAFDVDYATANGTALAGSDFTAASGTLHFDAGQNSRTVTVTLNPDSTAEADEHFFLNLSNVSFGFINDGQGRAVIDNDDFQTLTGTTGPDTMDGLGSANILVGLAGDDIYYLDDDEDQVVEATGEGFDAVFTSDHYALAAGAEVEWLSTAFTAGTAALNLTGNGIANYLIGNAGTNTLDGGAGVDVMVGFGGDDVFVADAAGDLVYENAGEGFDAVLTSVSYMLGTGQSVEWLSTLQTSGTAALNLTGNALDQTLLGNNGANVLDGGGGADAMTGFNGDDVYLVDNTGDLVHETPVGGGGFDAILASVSYVLAADERVEWLSTASTAATDAISLTGNEIGQYLLGNNGANTLDGGRGHDVLIGFGGADNFAFTSALGSGNFDLITDFQSGTDRIALDDARFAGIGTPGAFDAGAFVTGAAAADSNDRIIYNSSTGQLFYDADGTGAGVALLFATLQGNPALTASDFAVI